MQIYQVHKYEPHFNLHVDSGSSRVNLNRDLGLGVKDSGKIKKIFNVFHGSRNTEPESRYSNSGFTLIELMAVILILGFFFI